MSGSLVTRDAACRREEARAIVARPSTVRTDDALPQDVTVEDLSQAGFSFTSDNLIPTGTIVNVGLAGAGRARAEVAWYSGGRHGCRFRPALTGVQVEAAFRQPLDAAITWLAPVTLNPEGALPSPQRGLSMSVRLILMAGTGLIGWALLAVSLHGLPAL